MPACSVGSSHKQPNEYPPHLRKRPRACASEGGKALQETAELLLDSLIFDHAVIAEDRVRSRHQQAALCPQLGSKGAQNRKPRTLTKDRAVWARRGTKQCHGPA